MFRVIEDEEKKRIIDDALEGERAVGVIATEAGINAKTLFVWLETHYHEHPDDPRRHLVQRDTGKWPEAAPEPEATAAEAPIAENVGVDGDNEAREDMGAKKKRPQLRGELNPIRQKALELLKEGKLSQADIARQLHTSEGSVSFWKKQALRQEASKGEQNKLKAAVIADFKAGYIGESLVKRHKNKAGKTAVYRWIAEYRKEQAEKLEQKKAAIAHAREVHRQRLEADPEYREHSRKRHWRNRQEGESRAGDSNGQLALPGASDPTESTQISRPAPSERAPRSGPVAAIVEYRAEFPPDSRLMSDTLKEAIEERNTLRGMVTILQREQETLKKELEAYKRTLGDRR